MSNIKNEVRRLFKTGFFHIFGGHTINKIISFLSSIVLVRLLTKSEYGIFTYAWNIYCLVVLANGFGVESGILQLCSEQSGDEKFAKQVCNYGTRLGYAFDVVLSVIILCIGLFAPMKISGAESLLCLLSLLPIIQLTYNISTVTLRTQKRNKEYAALSLINTILIFAFSVIGAVLFKEKGLVFSYYAAYTITIIVAFGIYKVQLISKCDALSQKDRHSIISISATSMVNNGLSQIMYLLDVFVLGIVAADETILASYKVATIIPTALTFIPSAVVTYLYPYFAEKKDDGTWCIKKYKQVLLSLGAFNLFITAFLFIGAPLIVELLFGNDYADTIPIFRLLVCNYFISGTFRTLSGNLLVTQRKLKFNLLVAIIAGSVNVVADYFFIQWWGAYGAAYATIMVVLISSIMSTSYLIYTFKSKRKKES